MASDILIVDDEADICELVAGLLQDEGYATRTARDSDGALNEIKSRRPNLLFLDIWLQGSRLDGLQLLDTVKEQHPDMPVVMISGHGNIETAVAAIKRGAYDFIEKPFKADRLVLVADRALETSRLQARGEGAQGADAGSDQHGRPFAVDQPASPGGREDRADQQPHHDRRPIGLRQGAHRPPSACAVGTRGRAVRCDQRCRHHARN